MVAEEGEEENAPRGVRICVCRVCRVCRACVEEVENPAGYMRCVCVCVCVCVVREGKGAKGEQKKEQNRG